ncbi:MAG: helix-turn-helix domain-containing protein [Acidobacteria bacterium]|nr:helix-turn-helix domain-containing protein [Acidobacteriota bacterium]
MSSREEAVSLSVVPKLEDLMNDPGKVKDLPLEAVPNLRAELAKLDSLLLMRLAFPQSNDHTEHSAHGDRLLSVEEAARKLGKSKDHLYRHAGDYAFTVRDGRSLRFSEQGIEKFIRQRMGR